MRQREHTTEAYRRTAPMAVVCFFHFPAGTARAEVARDQGSPAQVDGDNFQPGAQVYVAHAREPWPSVTLESATGIVLRGEDAVAERFPVGKPVLVRVVNPDGGETFVSLTREEP